MRSRSKIGRRRAATVVEFAVVALVLLPVLFSMFEYCRYVMTRQLMENAAREGARFAVVHTDDKTTSDVVAVVQQKLAGQQAGLTGFGVQVYRYDPITGASGGAWTNAAFNEGVCVQIDGVFHPVAGWLKVNLPIQVKAVMGSEAN